MNPSQETLDHIHKVQEYLSKTVQNLSKRAVVHDASKLLPPERDIFDGLAGSLKGLTYGSDEYRAVLKSIKPAIEHHYTNNTHHPEFYENGISGMSLLDLLEMLVDWKAAGERHSDGCVYKSIQINKERFGISDQLVSVLQNTAKELGFEPS